MKKEKILFVGCMVLLGTALVGCGKSSAAPAETTITKNNDYRSDLFDWQKLYEKAEFEKYKEPASVNGLDGTLISVKGAVVSEEPDVQSDKGEHVETFIISDYQDNEWVFSCTANTEVLPSIGDEIIAYGEYLGASASYEDRPACYLIRYVHRMDERNVHNTTSNGKLAYEEFEKNESDVSSISVTPTAEPTQAVTPEPTVAPITEPNIYDGNGDSVIDISAPDGNNGAFVLYVKGNSESSHFAVKGYDSNNNPTELFVNTTDPYEGQTIDPALKTVQLEISAKGPWHIESRSLLSCRQLSPSSPVEGSGDEILLVSGGASIAHISGNTSERHFAVKAYGSSGSLLVNTTDPYDGTTKIDPDATILEVTATGEWSINLE